MRITVLAFGIVKDKFKGSAAEVDLSEGSTVNELKILLEEKCLLLKQLASYMIAINCEYASLTDSIHPGDEIAVIPPVSGG